MICSYDKKDGNILPSSTISTIFQSGSLSLFLPTDIKAVSLTDRCSWENLPDKVMTSKLPVKELPRWVVLRGCKWKQIGANNRSMDSFDGEFWEQIRASNTLFFTITAFHVELLRCPLMFSISQDTANPQISHIYSLGTARHGPGNCGRGIASAMFQ